MRVAKRRRGRRLRCTAKGDEGRIVAEDVKPEDLADDEPLIGSGLNLDSIDALELVVTLEKEFGIKISSSEESRQALASVAHLAEYIRSRADPARLAS